MNVISRSQDRINSFLIKKGARAEIEFIDTLFPGLKTYHKCSEIEGINFLIEDFINLISGSELLRLRSWPIVYADSDGTVHLRARLEF